MQADNRLDRHLMRRRGAGARDIKTHFGFSLAIPSPSSSSSSSSNPIAKDATPSSKNPALVALEFQPPAASTKSNPPRKKTAQRSIDAKKSGNFDEGIRRSGRIATSKTVKFKTEELVAESVAPALTTIRPKLKSRLKSRPRHSTSKTSMLLGKDEQLSTDESQPPKRPQNRSSLDIGKGTRTSRFTKSRQQPCQAAPLPPAMQERRTTAAHSFSTSGEPLALTQRSNNLPTPASAQQKATAPNKATHHMFSSRSRSRSRVQVDETANDWLKEDWFEPSVPASLIRLQGSSTNRLKFRF